MNGRSSISIADSAAALKFNPTPGLMLQRKCACGGTPGPSGKCEECREKRLAGQQREFLGMQTKLAIGASNDPLEQEADKVADHLLAAQAHPRVSGLSPRIQPDPPQATGKMKASPTSINPVPTSSGGLLEPVLRQDMEKRFGHDFSHVRVHSDSRAALSARSVNALAYTVGRDIVFGAGQYAPHSNAGQRLLAHELTHVIQQSSQMCVQRQEIPAELQASEDVSTMSNKDLQDRYDWIQSVLSQFNASDTETALLEEQAGNVGTELARRLALETGRTFSAEAIERLRAYFVKNAKTEADACIVALNKGVKLLLDDPKQLTTNKSIEKTMEKISASGRSSAAQEIWFESKRGIVTKGSARPERPHENIWDVVLNMAGGDPGWSVFTMSLLDGYHTVTLTLDTNNPSQPSIFWSDQWESKGGWKKYSRAELDSEVTKLVQSWWDEQAEGKKHNTVIRLWRLRQGAQAQP